MIKTWRARLNKRVGEAIFLAAQRDYVTGDLQRVTPATWVAHVIAALILTTPVLMLGAGLMLIYIGWPHLLALIVGAILIAVGWWLFPRRAKLPNGCLSREDLPDTFAMFDQISAGMNAPLITKLLLDDDFNAAVAVIRRERVLVIGALLWATLEDDQKIAVLAHEIGHLVNNDPTRSGFVGAALAARGIITVVPDYRLYPEVRYPDYMADAAQAAVWVQQNVQGDPSSSPLIVMGHSGCGGVKGCLDMCSGNAPHLEEKASLMLELVAHPNWYACGTKVRLPLSPTYAFRNMKDAPLHLLQWLTKKKGLIM